MNVACDIATDGPVTIKDDPTGTADGKTSMVDKDRKVVMTEISKKTTMDDSETAITTPGEDSDEKESKETVVATEVEHDPPEAEA